MFITLTNASLLYRGTPLAIKKDIIVSVFEEIIGEGEETEKVTALFSTTGNTWTVEESFEEVVRLLNA